MDNGMKTHQMKLSHTYPDGAQKWTCPHCGRQVLMKWAPDLDRVILEVGNDQVIHQGAAAVHPVENLDLPAAADDRLLFATKFNSPELDAELNPPSDLEEYYLAPYVKWLNGRRGD